MFYFLKNMIKQSLEESYFLFPASVHNSELSGKKAVVRLGLEVVLMRCALLLSCLPEIAAHTQSEKLPFCGTSRDESER